MYTLCVFTYTFKTFFFIDIFTSKYKKDNILTWIKMPLDAKSNIPIACSFAF